jgi:activating signal cointegrator complex subunit 2
MAMLTLPHYPSTKTRASLSPSQQATLNSKVSGVLSQLLTLPASKQDISSAVSFILSYAKDHAQNILESLIWDSEDAKKSYLSKLTVTEKIVHQRVFQLAETLATDLPLQAVLDICVVYGRGNPKRVRALLTSIAAASSQFVKQLEAEAVPAFTTLLSTQSQSQGLYGLRKIAYVLSSLLAPAPPVIVRPFAQSKHFVLALAQTYDASMFSLARSYGGFHPDRLTPGAQVEDWERVFLETKVDLIDSLHVILRTLLKDVEDVPTTGSALAARCEVAFEIVFALLEVPPARTSAGAASSSADVPTPFLNRTILEDYQHTYDLSKILKGATRRADDPRTELLEAALDALDTNDDPRAKPGALKLLIRSSGVPPGIDNMGRGPSATSKGKGRAAAVPETQSDPALDAAVTQVLDILPDQDPGYVRYVLQHPDYPYKGDGERLIGALLEGTAPVVDEAQYLAGVGAVATAGEMIDAKPISVPAKMEEQDRFAYTRERRNVFDDEKMDLSKLRIGKKQYVSSSLSLVLYVSINVLGAIETTIRPCYRIAPSSNK